MKKNIFAYFFETRCISVGTVRPNLIKSRHILITMAKAIKLIELTVHFLTFVSRVYFSPVQFSPL